MALICDTGGVYALYDADDAFHAAAKVTLEAESGPLFLPLLLLAEIDYLLTVRLGADAALDFLESVESGTFNLVSPTAEDLARCRQLMVQYRGLPLGVSDASVVATAERFQIRRIFTVDHRHFRAIQPRGLEYFVLLPRGSGVTAYTNVIRANHAPTPASPRGWGLRCRGIRASCTRCGC